MARVSRTVAPCRRRVSLQPESPVIDSATLPIRAASSSPISRSARQRPARWPSNPIEECRVPWRTRSHSQVRCRVTRWYGRAGIVAVGLSVKVRLDPRERAARDAPLGEVVAVTGLDQRLAGPAVSEVAGRNVGVHRGSQSILEQAAAAAQSLDDDVVRLSLELVERPNRALIERIALRLEDRCVLEVGVYRSHARPEGRVRDPRRKRPMSSSTRGGHDPEVVAEPV